MIDRPVRPPPQWMDEEVRMTRHPVRRHFSTRALVALACSSLWTTVLLLGGGCQNLCIPRIDPYGEGIFLPPPNRTQLNPDGPSCFRGLNCFSSASQPAATAVAPMMPGTPPVPLGPAVGTGMFVQPPVYNPVPTAAPANPPTIMTPVTMQPMVTTPMLPPVTKSPPCENQCVIGSCLDLKKQAKQLGVPATNPYKLFHRGQRGELLVTPSKIVAPVGSEVLVLAGICGPDGYFVTNQPIEFNLSQDSVGQIIDYQGRPSKRIGSLLPAKATKSSGSYLTLTTARKAEQLKRGTPTNVDDIHVEKGQSWLSVSSASPGTSYVTAVAPQAEAWDKRLKSMEIQWVDALWTLPTPATATAGAKYPLITNIRQTQDGLGVGNWKVRYQIAGGAAAQFMPSGSQTAEVITGPNGNASVEIQQPSTEIGPGTTFVRVDVIRPSNNAAGFEVIESGVTSIRWAAPALTIRAIGPRTVAIATPFSYRLEITNPGDQLARETTVTLDGLPEGLTFVSSNPKPSEYGNRLAWTLGDVRPGSNPTVIDLQLKSDTAIGLARLCFDVASSVDQLQTRACAETQVVAPCLGVKIDGDRQGRVGDVSTFNLTFVNQCEEPLRNLTARVVLEGSGLEIVGKSGPVTFGPMATPLAFGESKSLQLVLRLREAGTHCFRVDVQADGGHTATIRRCISSNNVNQPGITLQLASEGTALIGQEHRVVARVTNTGNVPLTGLRLRTANSTSLEPIGASLQAFEENGLIFIPLETIVPGSSRDVTLGYQGIALDGNGFARFQIQSDQGVEDLKEVAIRVIATGAPAGLTPPTNPGTGTNPGTTPGIGIPGTTGGQPTAPGMLAVQLTTNSPIARRQTSLDVEIAVSNQRTTSDQNVRILLQTPPGLAFQGVVGGNLGVQSSLDGLQHEFTTIQELRAGDTVRFTVRLLPEQTGTPRLEATAVSAASAIPSTQVLDITVTP